MSISRDKLYHKVWSEPMTKVAPRYKISNVALAKVCRRLRVPYPPRSYWAKLAAGQSPERPALPEARSEDGTVWLRDGEEPRRKLPRPPDPPPAPPPEAPGSAPPPDRPRRSSSRRPPPGPDRWSAPGGRYSGCEVPGEGAPARPLRKPPDRPGTGGR